MNDSYNFLFKYLEKEEIQIDKTEFLFQLQSHPDYSTLLAVSDTLNFFDIDNFVAKIDFEDIDKLPNKFIALLNVEFAKPQFWFIEKKEDMFFCTNDKTIKKTKSELEARWNGIVLLTEKNEIENAIGTEKNNLSWVLPLLSIGLFLSLLFLVEENLLTKLFFIFPVIGILFSIAALKDLFGAQSELLNNFCNITSTASCSSVMESKKWKIFSLVDLSSLSIVFFATQLVSFFLFLLSNSVNEYFYIQKMLLFGAVPVTLLSVYYQKFVEKKWCPICLSISSILILELSIFLSFQESSETISLKSIVLFGFVLFATVCIWELLKTTLLKQKELKEFQLTGNRFMRNYEVFKNTLISKDWIDLPNSSIVLGNNESNTELTIITNPFCGHCGKAHKNLDKILTANKDSLKIKILINVDLDTLDDGSKAFLRSLMFIYFEKGNETFVQALSYWFETRNLEDWTKKYGGQSFESDKIDSIYKQQNQWCKNNDFNFTPAIFINGYLYPKTYNRESLKFFINEIIEDDFFEDNQIEERAIIETI